jgi:protein TonB
VKQSAVRAARREQVVTIAPAPSGAGAEILALTEDDFFLLAVRRVVTLPNRVWHATSDAQAADMLMQTPYAVVLIDAALVTNQLAQVVTKLKQQLPDLGFVVAGDSEHRASAQALVDDELVEGFVLKEEATERLAGVLEAGINRHLELQTEIASKAAKSGGKRGLVIGGIAAVVVAGAAGAWLFLSQEEPAAVESADAVVPAARPVDTSLGVVDAALQRARDAFDAGNYTEPKGKSALDYYRSALAADKTNAEATDGIHRVAEVMLARAEASLLESKPRDAQASVKVAKSIEPSHPRIPFLEQQIARELERTAAAQQEAARLDAQSQKLSSYVRLANERLAQDRLIEPANDNARHYLMLARDVDSASTLVSTGLRSLANKMVQKSTQAASRGDLETADQWLAQARQLGVTGIDFVKVDRENRSMQRAKASDGERLLGLARERIAQGQLIEPENDNARYYVAQLRRQHADTAGLGPVVDTLRDQLLQRAAQAAGQTDAKLAQTYLDEAKSIGASGPAFDAAARLVASARARADALSTVKPVRDNMVVKSVTPEYPAKAQRRKQQGFVDLNFTTTVEGDVKDVVVVRSQPEEVFDDAAIRAIRRWKFKPVEVNGEPVEQRLSLRISFQLTE